MLILTLLLATELLGAQAGYQEAIQHHDYIRAQNIIETQLHAEPNSASLLKLLGGVHFRAGHYQDAVDAFDRVSELDSANRFTLAMALIVLEQRQRARAELKKLPVRAANLYWLGRLDFADSMYPDAIEKFRKVIQWDPGFARAYDALGLCYEAQGRLDQAIVFYRESVRRNADGSPWPAHNLGALLLKQDRLEEAKEALRTALQADARFPKAHYQLGRLLEKQGRDEDALDEYTAAAELDPAFPEPHFAMSRIYRKRHDTENMKRALERFEHLDQGVHRR